MIQLGQQSSRWFVLGLGNPGAKYRATRHNAGVWALEILAAELGVEFKLKASMEVLLTEGRIGECEVVLCFPQTFMNESGRVLSPLRRKFGAMDPARLIVIHDELDLPPGVVRVKSGGGLAGHNGLRSIAAHLGGNEFIRVRIGIGHPGDRSKVLNWVLSSPAALEREEIAVGANIAKDAVVSIVKEGVDRSMGEFNGRAV